MKLLYYSDTSVIHFLNFCSKSKPETVNTMKKLLVFLLPILFLASCDDDEQIIVNLRPSLTGSIFTVTENMSNGTVVGTISASDPEGTALIYSITSGNTSTAFALDATSGELSISNMDALDFEANMVFNLTVEVSDGEKTDSGIIVVNIGDDASDNVTRFKVTITNAVNYLYTKVFNTPDGAMAAGPIPTVGGSYSVTFKAFPPGTKLSFATMDATSNDWFFAPDGKGISLYTTEGVPVTGDITGQIMLWDGGTEAEDPAAWPTVDPMDMNGADDANTSVRVIDATVNDYIKAELAYNAGEFTLTITNMAGGGNGIVLTPGLMVLHAQENPLFQTGAADWGRGLKDIAEQGDPSVLYGWFTEEGSQGPLRMSRAMTPFAPAFGLTFTGDTPIFDEGTTTRAAGLETLAEDGSPADLVSTFTGAENIRDVATSTGGPIGPGGQFSFEIDAQPGDKFTFTSMFIQSNDWFFSFGENGIALFDDNGNPLTISGDTPDSNNQFNVWLFNAGTEVDQSVGFGADQAPRQSGGNTGMTEDIAVERVTSFMDDQFGKAVFTTSSGVAHAGDPRGGYNMIRVHIEPIN